MGKILVRGMSRTGFILSINKRNEDILFGETYTVDDSKDDVKVRLAAKELVIVAVLENKKSKKKNVIEKE